MADKLGIDIGGANNIVKSLRGAMDVGEAVKKDIDSFKNVFNYYKNNPLIDFRKPPHLQEDIFNIYKTFSLDNRFDDVGFSFYPIIFMTKPQIPFFIDDFKNLDFSHLSSFEFIEMVNRSDKMFEFLGSSTIKNLRNGNFIRDFSLFYRNVSLPDASINVEPTITGIHKQKYMQPSFFSGRNGLTFNLETLDDSDMTLTKIIYAWHLYIKEVTRGRVSPIIQNIMNNIIDYKSNLYIIGMKPNFQDVQFVARYAGIFPVNVPFSSINLRKDTFDLRESSIEFSYDYFDIFNEGTRLEFNFLARELGFYIQKFANEKLGISTGFDSEVNDKINDYKDPVTNGMAKVNEGISGVKNKALDFVKDQKAKITKKKVN